MKLSDIPHTCCNCDLRHSSCCSGTFWLDACPEFVLGKCYRCKHHSNDPTEQSFNEINDICLGEDMSGFGCPNFAE